MGGSGQRLLAAGHVNDAEAPMRQPDATLVPKAFAVGPAVGQSSGQRG
jgi:hypothetical protein